MLIVSENFKQAIKQPTREIRTALILANGAKIASNDELASFSIERTGAPFLSSMSGFSAVILGVSKNLINQVVQVEIEVKTNFQNNTFEKINLGSFRISESSVNLEKNTTTIKGFDFIAGLSTQEYSAGSLTFPASLADLVAQIANKFNLEFKRADFERLPNANFTISKDLWEKINKTTFRSILDEICGATATTAIVQNSALRFEPIKRAKIDRITYSELKSLKFKPKNVPINTLTLARTPQEDNIFVKDNEKVAQQGESEFKLANNEILDKNRTEVISPIFEAVKGYEAQPFEAETIGLFWFEIGDRVEIQNGDNFTESVISGIKIEISGLSIKESLVGKELEKTKTDYKRAGGIARTIFNTEIVVDKQKQEIESVISQKEKLESETFEKFSRLDQTLTDFNYTLSKTGGLNLLKNSAFYSFDEKTNSPNFWIIRAVQNLSVENSAEARSKGAVSGRKITIRNDSLTQTVAVASNFTSEKQNFYSFSCRIKKPVIGSGKIEILDGETVARTFEITEGTSFDWAEVKIEGILPQNNTLSLKITANANSTVAFADLNLANNKTASVWTQAQGEISNANLHIDEHGLIIKSSINEGDYTAITPLEFSGYSKIGHSIQRVFTVNKDTTEVKKFKAEDEIDMSPIKIVAIKDGEKTGWAFVANSKGER